MNWILLCGFNLLLFNSCLTVNIDRGLSANYIQQQNKSDNGAPVEAFNEDFMLPIFDLAEFEEILQMAKKPESADFVKNAIFPAKYPNYTFHFYYQANGNPGSHLSREAVSINDFDLFMDVITHFGEHINKINIMYNGNMNEEDSAALNERISEHCSNSLTTSLFGCIKEYTFTHFTKPFPNMKWAYVIIYSNEIGSILPFDEIFPNLETLILDYSDPMVNNQNEGIRFIESEFPAMEHLIDLAVHETVQDIADVALVKNQVRNMLQKNPQIRNFLYGKTLDNFIHEINEYLPNLEYLEIYNLNPEIRPVHFENVRHLKVSTYGMALSIDKTSFSRLEILDLVYHKINVNGTGRESWVQFFRNHQNLSQINCQAAEDEGVVEFLAELPNLHEMNIQVSRPFDIDLVSRLIEGRNNLVKFFYESGPRDESVDIDMDGFLERHQNEWTITYGASRGFASWSFVNLERKN